MKTIALAPPLAKDLLLPAIEEELQGAAFIDIHTHLFKPSLGSLGLWGIDELVTYHYLEAELFRSADITKSVLQMISPRSAIGRFPRRNKPISSGERSLWITHPFPRQHAV